jgi:hypothetical protein
MYSAMFVIFPAHGNSVPAVRGDRALTTKARHSGSSIVRRSGLAIAIALVGVPDASLGITSGM